MWTEFSYANCVPFYLHCFANKNKWKQIIIVLIVLGMYKSVLQLAAWSFSGFQEIPKSVNDHLLLDGGLHGYAAEESEGCIIPVTQIVPEFFRGPWNISLLPNCSYEKLIGIINEEKEELVLNPKFLQSNCCIHEVTAHAAKNSPLTSCVPMDRKTSKVNISMKEAFIIKCNDSINLEVNIPVKKEIEKKLKFWEAIPRNDRPVSVLLLGIDSVSRAHAYRSLPKTMKYMKDMGFIDFRNYHSIAPSTLTNFLAFLTGMTRPQVRGTCASDWTTPFDKCPIIWKNFSQKYYITSYMEDWGQTFSWGGQAGFNQNPTDYYAHQPFLALRVLRQQRKVLTTQGISMSKLKQTKNASPHGTHNEKSAHNLYNDLSDLNLDCASNESVPEFILRYLLRFSKKFRSYPFFSFAWINNPFHEENKALKHYDNHFLRFFQNLRSDPNILDRLLLIFLSDHGDRTGYFLSKSFESFLERGLPPLFIKIPDQLKIRFPLFFESLRENADKLTTPFDIHHTLLHISSLYKNNSITHSKSNETTTDEFTGVLQDRSSLFSSFLEKRSCKQRNIPPTNCLCNIKLSKEGWKWKTNVSEEVLAKMLLTAVQELNLKIKSSKYQDVCAKWDIQSVKTLYLKKIGESQGKLEFILAFVAQHGKAKFEARIILFLKSEIIEKFIPRLLLQKHIKGMEFLGLSRINKYGDQSLCVNDTTDFDKELKEFCTCKTYLQRLKA